MALPLPHALSPSGVASFSDCALAFRFSVVERLPQLPAPWSTKGTLVHTALELLHLRPAPERTLDVALECLRDASRDLRDDPDFTGLDLDTDAEREFFADAEELVRRYFQIEDPREIRSIGLEISMRASIGGVRLRGIIDRLELDADGELVVTDYKTGSVPPVHHERKRLSGVHLYSLLCEEVLGRRPRRVQLLYLRQPVAIITEPTDRTTRGCRRTLDAMWQAIERACQREDFRPRPSALCNYCAFRAYCPAFGGDPDAASELLAQDGGVEVDLADAGASGPDQRLLPV
jgi:putative RecB family exonuclease